MGLEKRYTVQFPIVITEEMAEAIREYCEEHRVPKAEVGRRALDALLPKAARGYQDR